MIQFAVLGYGTVGSGVVEVFFRNRESLEKKAGVPLGLKYILDVREFPDSPYKDLFVKDFDTILNDASVGVVAEVIGGVEPALTFTKACLERGKSVVTSNKELVAQHGAELLAIARANNVNYLFEASVGGGIPIIRPLHSCLAANRIEEVIGILNGTTNFILTKMFREGMSFESALALAQRLGYAERDPAADVEGHDACRKICILASLAFGEHVYPHDVSAEGITKITSEDVAYAASCGCVIKLIGAARRGEGGKRMTAYVAPAFINRETQLGTIDDVFNGILVRGDATGDVVFYGKGAGKLPTASAVVSDMIACAKADGSSASMSWKPSQGGNVAPQGDHVTAMYLRCRAFETNALEEAVKIFGKVKALSRPDKPTNEAAFITPALTEREIDDVCGKLAAAGIDILGKIRVLADQ
ncbi:homoserine dehydrogenase [Anaerotruncus colihominis]|uniref:Homoserine dehydrogenase n=1 Tax=Anaerotruncus colihominis DSM 17241 TaxID=445972 RepID=B0PHG4_9FIRM|nr:homoserine dehydrogenase [Anaerotruncus colihominis]EDS08932.1 homoserine dehydrogenase [Anaerotruncus colihominis DSM 17241]UWN73506.1 homoserine dehydrogenase [Anaerotruncus colihominis]